MPRCFALLCALLLCAAACSPRVSLLGSSQADPLQETTLRGKGPNKILLIHARGFLDSAPNDTLLGQRPSNVQEIVSRLEKAREDDAVKAVLLAVDSPGGTAADSQTLHHEVLRFKHETGAPVAAMLMTVAASGGYYLATAADRIVAHPAVITGSIGTIFIRPDVTGLMDMVGVKAEVIKTGRHKDMVSPFRDSTPQERALVQTIIDEQNSAFLAAVQQSRNLSDATLQDVADARILSAGEAVRLGLADRIGTMEDALAVARELTGLEEEETSVTVYRRTEYENDTVYNTASGLAGPALPSLLGPVMNRYLAGPRTGVYHVWAPEWAWE